MKSQGNKHDFHDENEANFDESDDPQWDPVAADDDDDALPEMMCPSCRDLVTEDTQKCPSCGDWITPVELRSGKSKRWLFGLAVGLMLVAMILIAFR
jgi:hypothetical protein